MGKNVNTNNIQIMKAKLNLYVIFVYFNQIPNLTLNKLLE